MGNENLVPSIFEHEEFGQVRVVIIDGEAWFVGKDVAVALGYVDTFAALKQHVPDKCKCVLTAKQMASNQETGETSGIFSDNEMGGVQRLTFVNEAGLYRLVLRSKLPKAEEFTDWTCEVLVSLRKTGSYTLPSVATDLERERLEVEKLQLATEQARLEVERDRLALERDDFAKAQLLRELASASGDNQSMRNNFLKEARKLLIGEVDDEEFLPTD